MEEDNKNNDDKEKDIQTLKNRRVLLNERRVKSSDYFDKYILSFSTGALYLSIISLNNKQDVNFKSILGIGWIFLIITIIATIISFVVSEKAFEQQMDVVDEKIKALFQGGKIKIYNSNCFSNILDVIKIISSITFISGIIILTIFYFLNL